VRHFVRQSSDKFQTYARADTLQFKQWMSWFPVSASWLTTRKPGVMEAISLRRSPTR
jgi:hypothetical protein